jgi:hypothetical protein
MSRFKKCIKTDKSVFKHSLVIKPDGTIQIANKYNKRLASKKGRRIMPPIKRVLNTRVITIMEANNGCDMIYVKPPGKWYKLS